jgi:hypothetical protein
LLRSSVPSAHEISRIEKSLGDNCTLDSFLKCTFWFEEGRSERSKDRENAIVFQRVRIIKELLF